VLPAPRECDDEVSREDLDSGTTITSSALVKTPPPGQYSADARLDESLHIIADRRDDSGASPREPLLPDGDRQLRDQTTDAPGSA